ncbi:antifreeze protein [Crassisporium funariophilum]|nr:antifreeze protein [Crassisporium funariophilum]
MPGIKRSHHIVLTLLCQALTSKEAAAVTLSRRQNTAVNLGTFADYVILAQAGVSTVPTSAITGDLGLWPAADTYYTGFSEILSGSGTESTAMAQVTGVLKAANYATPTPSDLTIAVGDCGTAYDDAAGRTNPTDTDIGSAGSIGGLIITTGLYKFTGSVSIPTDVYISGSATDRWIFQITGTLIQTGSTQVVLSGGALPQNIVWVVGGAVTIGGSAIFNGVVLGGTSVTLETGSTLNGRICAGTNVALQSATVTEF